MSAQQTPADVVEWVRIVFLHPDIAAPDDLDGELVERWRGTSRWLREVDFARTWHARRYVERLLRRDLGLRRRQELQRPAALPPHVAGRLERDAAVTAAQLRAAGVGRRPVDVAGWTRARDPLRGRHLPVAELADWTRRALELAELRAAAPAPGRPRGPCPKPRRARNRSCGPSPSPSAAPSPPLSASRKVVS